MEFKKIMKVKLIEKVLTWILVITCIVLFVLVIKKEVETATPVGLYGQPAVFVENSPLKKFTIKQVADDSKYLYLLDESNGVLLVFDLQGTYKHTISFYDTLNGAFRMSINQDILYVEDTQGNLYILHFGEFERFVKKSDRAIYDEVDFEQTSSNYEILLDGVYKKAADEDICIIRKPLDSLTYNTRWNMPRIIRISLR
jgi:hypothetical protein